MKPAGVILVSLLLVLALASCLFSVRWFFAISELQRLQARFDAMTRTSSLMQQLAGEAIEYGRRNPAIHPVLNQLNLRASGLAPTNAAVGNPSIRLPDMP